MKVVVPMAGRGTRLSSISDLPKPFIEINGKPMIYWALKSLEGFNNISEVIFIILSGHKNELDIVKLIDSSTNHPKNCVFIDKITEGQLCTVLSARDFIESDEDLLIMSCDTYVQSQLYQKIVNRKDSCKGIISVKELLGDQWSFVAIDNNMKVIEVAEKRRISDYASTGMYYFSNGNEFVKYSNEVIKNKISTNGEYYIIPVYGEYIKNSASIEISIASEVWDMGNPVALKEFIENYNKLGFGYEDH